MPEALDIKKVISTSTSSVSLEDLSKKGFKQVKVLNQNVITRLIGEAVDHVLDEKAKIISKEERERVVKEARNQFEVLAKERLEKERSRIQELEEANDEALARVRDLEQKLALQALELERSQMSGKEGMGEAMAEKLLAAMSERLDKLSQPTDVKQIMLSLDTLSRRLSNMGTGGGGGGMIGDPEQLQEVILANLFDKDKGGEVESNVANVKVKQAKAGGVKGALAKLKKLQKGGEDGE